MAKTEENGTDYPAVLRDGITVTGLLYGDASFNNWMPFLAQQTNGDFLFNSEYDPKDAQDTLINLAPDFNEITLLYQQVSLSDSTIEINVYVDETVGISTKFSIMFSAIGGTSVIIDPDGKQLADGVVVVDDAAPGIWSITLDNANKGTAEVKVTSNPRSGVEQVEVVTWTSASNRGEVDLDTEGLAFFVSVTQGNKPVTNLEVEVTVYPAEGGSQALHVTLKDDGRGDPDVQFLDGVYSSYVTNFDSLTFTDMMFFADVSVQSATQPEREKTFASVKKTKLGALPYDPFLEEPCCGSTATGGIELSLFRHISGGASVAVINGPGFEPYDPPPSQITNVEITNVDQEGPMILAGTTLVTMTWQAPGKDFTDGIVSGYEIWYSEFKAEITSSFESCSLVEAYEDDTPIPGPHGSLQTATIRLPKKVDEMTQYYLVVVALDGLQRGPPSSLLGVTVSAGESYTTTQATTTTLSSSSPDTTSQTSSSTNTVSTKTTIKTSTPPDTSISTTVTQTSTPPDTSISTTVTQTSTPPDTSISTTVTQTSTPPDTSISTTVTQTSTPPDTSISTTVTQTSTPPDTSISTTVTQTSTPPDTSISTTVTQTSTPPDTSISTTVTQTSTPPDTSISTTMTQSSSTFDVTTPSMTQTSTSPDTSISTTMTQISTTSDVTTPPSTDTSTQKPATQSTSTGESSATETTSTYFSETTTSQQPTEPPPGFVGSTGFWIMIGGLSLLGLLIIIVPAVYCFLKRRRASMEPSKPQMLTPQNKRKKKMGKLRLGDTSLYDNVQISDARGNDVEKGVASPSPVEGGINNHGFEVEGDTEENVQRSYNDSSDEDMITSL
ncbi:mucin-3A-like [Palaemon carinicauda]|uniref:mucin-3A-like n=1 Tax=Palaemon carinicauda TaxID=392227 RepID=UPI0035B6370C